MTRAARGGGGGSYLRRLTRVREVRSQSSFLAHHRGLFLVRIQSPRTGEG